MTTKTKNRVGLVVPHIFIHRDILPGVIFSPGQLALNLVKQLQLQGVDVTLFAPGPTTASVPTVTADLSYFEAELQGRGDTYLQLLKKHPFTFISLARQVQAELIAKAYAMANNDELDIIHIYTNEEDLALPFARLCKKPVVFTHHDPFNFLVKYKNVFPKYKDLNWISMSLAQRRGMPADTHWVGNIPHGIGKDVFTPNYQPKGQYVAYLGRIIEPKGVHIAIAAVKKYNETAAHPLTLKIAGKHYAGHAKDSYWQEQIEPLIDGKEIEYVGFIGSTADKQAFLGNARALLVPSLFNEPFGMVSIEALACGTPVVGLDSGAIPEVIENAKTGIVVPKKYQDDGMTDVPRTIATFADGISKALKVSRQACQHAFEDRFTLEQMAKAHGAVYDSLIRSQDRS
jgi:glycosyltransferase involved in cell wall biosynthesis